MHSAFVHFTVCGGLHRGNAPGQVRIYIINSLISIRARMRCAGETGTLAHNVGTMRPDNFHSDFL